MDRSDTNKLFAYTRWANLRALEAADRLSPEHLFHDTGSSFPSVFKTLEHMLAAEWVWLKRVNGISPSAMFDGHECKTLYELRERWAINDLEWTAFIEAMNEEDLAREIHYTNLAGDKLMFRQEQIMRHVPNHSTYHRGQVVTMLRQLGAGGFDSDLIFFNE